VLAFYVEFSKPPVM